MLPQVPVEEKWDRQTFLEETCAKAGMRSGCWKDENTDIFMFTAVVFGENKPQALMLESVCRLQAYPRGQESRRQVHRRTEPCGLPESKHRDEVAAQQKRARASAQQIDGIECAQLLIDRCRPEG